jgi:lipoate-protein ligase A
MATRNIKDMSEKEFRQFIREAVREALQVHVQKIDREDIDWEAASETVLQRLLDKARRRPAER